jgi:hypothetical protein
MLPCLSYSCKRNPETRGRVVNPSTWPTRQMSPLLSVTMTTTIWTPLPRPQQRCLGIRAESAKWCKTGHQGFISSRILLGSSTDRLDKLKDRSAFLCFCLFQILPGFFDLLLSIRQPVLHFLNVSGQMKFPLSDPSRDVIITSFPASLGFYISMGTPALAFDVRTVVRSMPSTLDKGSTLFAAGPRSGPCACDCIRDVWDGVGHEGYQPIHGVSFKSLLSSEQEASREPCPGIPHMDRREKQDAGIIASSCRRTHVVSSVGDLSIRSQGYDQV